MKYTLGFSAGFHDAAVALIDDHGFIEFAGHSERYSKIKNDANIHRDLVSELYGYDIDTVAYYERPLIKQLRQWYTGQGIDWHSIRLGQIVRQQLKPKILTGAKFVSYNHHLCHAAGGFQTSQFDRATVVVIDAVGEFETATIWGAEYDQKGHAVYRRLWQKNYPHSIGLFYSAVTGRVGLRPLDEEYILMGMAAYGTKNTANIFRENLIHDAWEITFRENLHAGLDQHWATDIPNVDLAAGAQELAEELIMNIMLRAKQFAWSNNLVYAGGVALNCVANRRLGELFDNIWLMPCPGDAGSSLGAAALAHRRPINWQNAYLGHSIPGPYPVDLALAGLLDDGIVGVASGRAEFGPRALGNRSLLADPRGPKIKDQVNEIKRRQQFRPFAPVILEEHVHNYFDMPRGWPTSRYMQTVGHCRRPDLFPAVVHVDGTSRVQTVPPDGSGIRRLLEAWYDRTACPMLLNTSLNIRGEPMVNDRQDADRFEQLYGVRVYS